MPLDPGWTAERILRALVDSLDEVILLYDADLRCRGAGARVRDLFALEPGDLLGLSRPDLIHRLAASSPDPRAFLSAIASASSAPALVDVARPEPRQLRWTTEQPPDAAPLALIDVLRDVTAERRAESLSAALAEAATIDPATGLLNRRRFAQDLDREHRRAQRVWEPYALALFDVDGAAALSEALGSSASDALLRELGEELRASRREYDLVGRWDGDRFIVCLPGTDAAATRVVLTRALGTMSERARASLSRPVAVSAGVAVWIPPSTDGPDDMIRRADAALERARRRGPSELVIDAGASRWKDDMDDI